jgi:5-methylthioadenosine/S-adenosylhomocysteine deaminase
MESSQPNYGLVIKGGLVVTGGADGTDYDPGALVTEGSAIRWIGPLESLDDQKIGRFCEVVEAKTSIVLPGFVNAHTHSNECFDQGTYDNLPLDLWSLYTYPFSDVPRLSERDCYLQAMLSAVECIRGGVTTVQDDLITPIPVPEPVSGAAKAYLDAGLRAVITVSMADRPALDTLPFLEGNMPDALTSELRKIDMPSVADLCELFRGLHATWNGVDDRISIVPAPVGPQWCSDNLLQEAASLAESFDTVMQSHVLETKLQAILGQKQYGRPVIEHLDGLSVLSPRLTLNHAIWATAREIELIGERGSSVCHNPLSNLKLGSGLCPVGKYLKAGVNVSLGTDGRSSSDTANLLEAIRLASLVHKIASFEYEDWISADDVFQMATVGGAQSAGLRHHIGTLEIGKKADIILLDRNHWSFVPENDIVRQLAFSATSEAIHSSIVGGKFVMRDRTLCNVDEDALKQEIKSASDRIKAEFYPDIDLNARRLLPYVSRIYRDIMKLPWSR